MIDYGLDLAVPMVSCSNLQDELEDWKKEVVNNPETKSLISFAPELIGSLPELEPV